MSLLEFYCRPLVAFDATNSVHRKYYHEFCLRNSWGTCPVRFICPEQASGSLVSMIQQSMLNYYVSKEFVTGGRVRAKAASQPAKKTVSQNAKKTVDSKAV